MRVEGAARIAADLGFRVVVVDDACAAWSPTVHEVSLRSLELLYCDVSRTEDLVKRIRRFSRGKIKRVISQFWSLSIY